VPDGKRDPSSRPDTGLAHSEVSLTRGRSVFLTRSLQRRLLFFGGILTFFPLAIIFLVVLNANERIGSAAQEESRKLAFADLDHIAQGVVQLMDGLYEQGGESETPSAEQLGILREHVQSFIVGQTGYVFVLDRAGSYVSSFQGKRDGENILDAKDASGRLFIRSMLAKAEKLQPGEMAEGVLPLAEPGRLSTPDQGGPDPILCTVEPGRGRGLVSR
jgi:hypothetical protein